MEFNKNIISLRQLRVLHLLVHYKSVSRVANILNISQPAVSRMVSALESDSPYTLFTRNKNKLVPTSYAIELDEMVRPILQDVEYLSSHFYDSTDAIEMPLNVALPSNAGVIFAGALEYFHKRTQGKVKVNTQFMAPKDVMMQVTEQQSNLGIVAYEIPTSGEVEVIKFAESPVCCVVHCNHMLSTSQCITFDDLKNEHVVVSSHAGNGTRRDIENALKDSGNHHGVTYGVDTFVACDLAKRGIGITLTSELTARTFFRDSYEVAVIPLEKTIMQPFSWIVPTTTPPTKPMLALMEEMDSFVKDSTQK